MFRLCPPLLLIGLALCGCSRQYYLRDADRETYGTIQERNDGAWVLPNISIQPPAESRLFDPHDPARPPMPPDDETAHQYMIEADGMHGYRHWDKDGVLATSHFNDTWLGYLPRDPDGSLPLNPERAVLIGQANSPSYFTELETLYLTALALTLNRFEFTCRWYLTNGTFFDHFGTSSTPLESNTLTTNTNFGFARSFAAGGQLLVDFANSFVFQYTGQDSFSVNSNIAASFIQPLLRNGGRDVRMEPLTQGERNLLYAVRDFARYRKLFYFSVTMRDGGYLGLLLLLQNIRNQEENVRRLEQIYQLHTYLSKSGSVSQVQVDQIFLSLKQGQAGLIQSRTGFESALDAYKFQLGLPPSLPVKLDDSQLNAFQLNTFEISGLEKTLHELDLQLRQPDQPPPLEELRKVALQLEQYLDMTEKNARQVSAELNQRLRSLPEKPTDIDQKQARDDLMELTTRLTELIKETEKFHDNLKANVAELNEKERQRDWERMQRRTRELIAMHADLLVYQTQVRVYQVELKPFRYTEDEAIALALTNRFDLMNARAQNVDAWRKIAVAANALEPGLTAVTGMNLATEPGAVNPFDFSAQASSYRVGVQMEAPLTRLIERNTFRASLIQYTRQRRSYQMRADQVVQTLRRNLRQLESDRLNFEIARQSLIAAARQLEASRGRLLLGGDASPATGTLDTLSALASLLQAKNTLIANWVNYETGRLQLLLDMEVLELDERGIYDEPAFINPPRDVARPAPRP